MEKSQGYNELSPSSPATQAGDLLLWLLGLQPSHLHRAPVSLKPCTRTSGRQPAQEDHSWKEPGSGELAKLIGPRWRREYE